MFEHYLPNKNEYAIVAPNSNFLQLNTASKKKPPTFVLSLYVAFIPCFSLFFSCMVGHHHLLSPWDSVSEHGYNNNTEEYSPVASVWPKLMVTTPAASGKFPYWLLYVLKFISRASNYENNRCHHHYSTPNVYDVRCRPVRMSTSISLPYIR